MNKSSPSLVFPYHGGDTVLKNEEMILNHLAFSFHHPPEHAVGKELKVSQYIL